MKSVVVSLGGSVLLADSVDSEFLKKLAQLIERLHQRFRLFIVVGGGNVARSYINRGRLLGFSEEQLDVLGIEVTQINARFLAMLISSTNQVIPKTTDDAVKCSESVVVMGGTSPGHSTDLVGAELAIKAGACRYIVATNVDGVFDKDPNKFSDAKQLAVVSVDDLLTSHGDSWETAGKNMVIDGPALRAIKEGGLNSFVVNGLRLSELEKAIVGMDFDGTMIKL